MSTEQLRTATTVEPYPSVSKEEASEVEQEILEDENKSIILGLISQLRKGMDLHRVTLPTFVLEPRSMLERIGDFMSHPDLLLEIPKQVDQVGRFIAIVKYFLSAWHIRPKGVKKPYNPVLGEYFRCTFNLSDKSTSYYIAEQVSHHPPASAYIYANPQNGIVVNGTFKPKSKYLGNSAATIMQGKTVIRTTQHPEEVYELTNPNVYARGILFGTMLLEMGDVATITCEASGLAAEIEFKVKGFFTGTYNAISGRIRNIHNKQTLYTLSGKWTETIYITNYSTKEQSILLEIPKLIVAPKIVPPESQQDEYESRRLWSAVTKAIAKRDMDEATDAKCIIEDNQRRIAKMRIDDGIDWNARFFVEQEDDDCMWTFNDRHLLDESKTESEAHLKAVMSKRDYNFSSASESQK